MSLRIKKCIMIGTESIENQSADKFYSIVSLFLNAMECERTKAYNSSMSSIHPLPDGGSMEMGQQLLVLLGS